MKKFLLITLCILLTLSFAACGRKTDTPTEAPAAITNEPAPTEAPADPAHLEDATEAPRALNTKNPLTFEKFNEVVKAELAVLSDEEHQGLVDGNITSGELENGFKYEMAIDQWYYEWDGQEGLSSSETVQGILFIVQDVTYQEMFDSIFEGTSEEELKNGGVEQGDNWCMWPIGVGVGRGVAVIVDNTYLELQYSGTDEGYLYEMVEKFVG
ncbi:MAG: hypothetical protein Q4F17_08580 [Eubacteriales bacterium]|nr:hypothetical protein [Eubacteriales bacterium]